ncbi:putative hydrolase [Mycobacteroides abscessus subsp. abscessus]|nr:putative hydrolase [Mycobacteroides abscessus subsp. abscessus]
MGYLARRVPGVRVKELVGQDHFAHREAPAVFAQALRELLLT